MLDIVMSNVLHIIIYFTIGLLALMVGRFFLDAISPYDLTHQTSEEDNPAVSYSEAGFYIGLAIIIHASVVGEIHYELFPFIDTETPKLWQVISAEVITTFLYYFAGLLCLGFGRKGLHWIMPYDVSKEIIEDRNVGVGVLEAAFFISTAIIIHGILA